MVLESAKLNPGALCIGIDACKDGLIEASRKASRSQKRGGTSNALFLLSSIEALPTDFFGIADAITINYPWGSLLKAVTDPDVAILQKIARIAKRGAPLRILLNWSVFENASYCERLGLSALTLHDVETRLKAQYDEAGLEIKSHGLIDSNPVATTWGQKLVKGSDRKVLSIEAVVR